VLHWKIKAREHLLNLGDRVRRIDAVKLFQEIDLAPSQRRNLRAAQ
jgi:hypothetical protein